MSTNATITVIDKANDKAITIYSHWDGYPEGVGQTLKDHYSTLDQALALVALGAVSSLGKSIDNPDGHSFNAPAEDCTVFYGRDRGEDDVACDVQSISSFKTRNVKDSKWGRQEYNYVFDNGIWKH